MVDAKEYPLRPALTGLTHMSFQSSDLEAALAYYRDVHGFANHLRLEGPGGKIERALVRINEAQWVDLRPEHEARSDRLIDFGLRVEDAEGMRLYLATKGVEVPAAATVGATGNKSFFVKDPDGHSLEFIELLPGGWPSRTTGKGIGPAAISGCLMHTGFAVFSLDRSLAFYRDILGCVEFWRGSSDERSLSWVHLRLPEDRNYVEFMLYDQTPSLEWLGVLNHFGLEVPSLPAAMEEASRRLSATPFPRKVEYSIGTCRHRLANVFDPDGTRAEFMERGTFDGSVTPSSPVPAPH